MKRLLLFLYLTSFTYGVFAQSLYLAYTFSQTTGGSKSIKRHTVFHEDTISYSFNELINTNTIVKSSSEPIYFVKNYKQNALYYNYGVVMRAKLFDIKDSLHSMRWELHKETKKIKNFDCKMAKTIFRGRTYTAYYTTKIPIATGPWKFGGLPGVILEISSDDGEFAWTIEEVVKNHTNKKPYEVDLKGKEFISWKQYTEYYREGVSKYHAKLKASTANSPGDSGRIRFYNIEIIDERSDTGKGLEY
jgi:GLPGLI family protein